MAGEDRQKRILIVDDDEDLQELLTIWLEMEGYEVLQTDSGVDAIGIAGTIAVDIVIVELTTPMLDGLRFLPWLREEEMKPSKILILTAGGRKISESEAMAAGASAVLHKPVRSEELLERLRSL